MLEKHELEESEKRRKAEEKAERAKNA